MHRECSSTPFSFINMLNATEWHALQAIAHPNTFKKNTYVFRADERNDAFYVLIEGRVKITRQSQHGRELIQWFCLPGEIFGLAGDNFSQQRGLYAQTITSAKVLCLFKREFEQYVLSNPRVALLVIKQLAARLRTLGDTLLIISSEDAQARLIKLLKRLIEFYGSKYLQGIHIDLYLTHQEMADMIGVCRQTVSNMIGQLKRDGIMNINRSGIYIHQPQRLDSINQQTTVEFAQKPGHVLHTAAV